MSSTLLHPTHEPLRPPEPPRRSRAASVASLAGAGVAALLALALLAAGGLLLYADGQKDRDGYLTTSSEQYATSTSALVSDDIDLDGVEELFEAHLGKVRLKVDPRSDEPVFVGIARTRDARSYLRGTAHATVTDVETDPFRAIYRTSGGDRVAPQPAEQSIWVASASGTGAQELTWDVEDGSWSAVLMNADGSPVVDASVSAGASAPFLDDLGFIVLGGGAVLVLLAGGLLVVAMRTRP
jgi:hypothetical protein